MGKRLGEVSDDAMVLITVSFGAFNRVLFAGKSIQVLGNARPCDELVTVVFLGLYVEASLTHIIKEMGEIECLKIYCNKRNMYDIHLLHKLVYFYNTHISKTRKEQKKASYNEFIKVYPYKSNSSTTQTVVQKLDGEFPGFKDIYEFRNKISHGELEEAVSRIITEYQDVNTVKNLRDQAKSIVDKLVMYARKDGHKNISKGIKYDEALKNLGWNNPDII